MVEVGVIVTVGTVLIILALTVTTRWIVPKVLTEESHDHDEEEENPSERSAGRPA